MREQFIPLFPESGGAAFWTQHFGEALWDILSVSGLRENAETKPALPLGFGDSASPTAVAELWQSSWFWRKENSEDAFWEAPPSAAGSEFGRSENIFSWSV